ncbi:hypothetical protein [Catenuloplanes indicus]|uniref:Uncharacterized protein n=1 Tax=Catenuloplanes indicus TaxID=137267 RepID=A0AAE4AX63_9ACTN|nr:hypothetical protein [Catenuloplanes indicus]MDQ0363783.1 hypothetical protein [Catenuloplanes indicus]
MVELRTGASTDRDRIRRLRHRVFAEEPGQRETTTDRRLHHAPDNPDVTIGTQDPSMHHRPFTRPERAWRMEGS